MLPKTGNTLRSAEGKLGVLIPGLGAVGTTFIAGVDAILRDATAPIGSLTQMGLLPTGDGSTQMPVREAVPLADLGDLVFGGWDIYEGSAYDAAVEAAVLDAKDLEACRPALERVRPMPAVFDSAFIRNIDGPNLKSGPSKMALARQLVDDIHRFIDDNGCERAVGVWCASTERFIEPQPVHQSIEAFEKGLEENHPAISPAMIYAWAFVTAGVPLANGAPNRALDVPAIVELAEREGVALAGKDFKTGQTLMKTVLAPGLAARYIGVRGWYSTNILGNRDGAVLDDPGSFKTKEESKLSVLESILSKEEHPALYEKMAHKVRIDYYPPRGDNKEGWDNIDIEGWMGYGMQIKINFLCRDSILAAPLVLDLALLMDLAQRAEKAGVQEWLSFYFKSPQTVDGGRPVHDLFRQLVMLQDTLRELGERALAPAEAVAAE